MILLSFDQAPARGPKITSITAGNSTSLNVTWKQLNADDANGIIRQYIVCYKVNDSSGDICSSSKTVDDGLNTVLSGLNKYTVYEVAVKAATAEGSGPVGESMINRTQEDSKFCSY